MRWLVFSVLAVLVCAGVYASRHWFLGMLRIAGMKDEDPELTRAYVRKYIDDSIPGFRLPEVVRGKAELKTSLLAMPAGTVTFDPAKEPRVITSESLADRRQYEVRIWNESEETFSDVVLRFQTPYPIESVEVSTLPGAVDVTFEPSLRMAVSMVGTGAKATIPRLLTRTWIFRAATLGPGGSAKILFVASSARDPRGRTIDPAQAQRYRVPEVGPRITYIDGSFFVKIDDSTRVKRSFYAPFSLTRDRVITLGEAAEPPKTIVHMEGFESPM